MLVILTIYISDFYIVSRKSFILAILFVCTKRQFTSIIESCAVKSKSHYVTQRWLGGMLTNWSTIKLCIENLQLLIKQESDGSWNRLNKKESLMLRKKKLKLEKYFAGVKNMTAIPDVVILVGQTRELNAVKECLKLGISLITVLDTNCDPTLTDFIIPANDDSVSSVSLILNEIAGTIVD